MDDSQSDKDISQWYNSRYTNNILLKKLEFKLEFKKHLDSNWNLEFKKPEKQTIEKQTIEKQTFLDGFLLEIIEEITETKINPVELVQINKYSIAYEREKLALLYMKVIYLKNQLQI